MIILSVLLASVLSVPLPQACTDLEFVAQCQKEVELTVSGQLQSANLESCYDTSLQVVHARNNNSAICGECVSGCVVAHSVVAVVLEISSIQQCVNAFTFAEVASQLAHLSLTVAEGKLYHTVLSYVRRKCLTEVQKTVLAYPPLSLPIVSTSPVRSPRTAVFIFNNPTEDPAVLGSIHLWECWAKKHGVAFKLDTDVSEADALGVSFAWLRWRRVRQALDEFDWVIVVQADMVVSPECWDFDFFRVFEFLFQTKHIVTRELFPPQAPNDGFTAFRNSPVARWFLDRVFEKHLWGIPDSIFDQSAFYETLLELLELERAAANVYSSYPSLVNYVISEERYERLWEQTPRNSYRSDCMQFHFIPPFADGRLVHQAFCLFAWLRELAGPPGARSSDLVGFVDPRFVDVNNIRHRIPGVPAEDAFIVHFAGRDTKWGDLEKFFGSNMHASCANINARGVCKPNNPGVPNPITYCADDWGVC